MGFWFFVLKCFYFMFPAYFANMAPVIVKSRFKFLAIPIDMGKQIRGKSLLGKNKTFRGLIFGVVFSIIVAFFQFLLYRLDFFKTLSFLDYSNWFILGFLFGFGALFGDLVESFFKRRLGVGSGKRFFPWDQLDFVIGALFFISFVFSITWSMFLIILLISVLGHISVNHVAYYLKIRDGKW